MHIAVRRLYTCQDMLNVAMDNIEVHLSSAENRVPLLETRGALSLIKVHLDSAISEAGERTRNTMRRYKENVRRRDAENAQSDPN